MSKNKTSVTTNVMRILEQKKIAYTAHEYPHGDDPVDGQTVAALIGRDPACVYKTLATQGASGAYYVFVIPVAAELNLKKAAKAAGEKSIQMLHVSQLTPLTGYVRGGCSPVGMKKLFPTYFDAHVEALPTVIVSAGKVGHQIETVPSDLMNLIRAKTADLIL
jgi:Cys-tRNA(Pro)/Cys-tRNA(Cys) deacylase